MEKVIQERLEEMVAEVTPRVRTLQRIILNGLVEKYLLEPGEYVSLDEMTEIAVKGLKRKYELRGTPVPEDLYRFVGDIWQTIRFVRQKVQKWGKQNHFPISVESHSFKGFRLMIAPLEAEAVAEKKEIRPEEIPEKVSGNLPTLLTRFIGRKKEVREVKEWLSKRRMVTLTGIGGIGKSRLAVQVAGEVASEYADGVWYCDLSDVVSPAMILPSFASALGLGEEARILSLEQLISCIKGKNLLVVADNCEHIIDSVASFLEPLLTACPKLRVLTTSREVLRVSAEAVYPVQPLAVPEDVEYFSLIRLKENEAVELFLDRAITADPNFRLDSENSSAVAEVCKVLEGIPLAIELAAAKARLLTPHQILSHLKNRLEFLTGGRRTAPARHQAIRACLDWSYNLLTPLERELFARLSVFCGTFPLIAVEKVCSDEHVREKEVMGLLLSLAEKSIIIPVTEGKETRYRLLDTMKAYAVAKLRDSRRLRIFQRKHFDYYFEIAKEILPLLSGKEQNQALDVLQKAYPNISSALQWGMEFLPATSLQFALFLEKFYDVRAYWEAGRLILEGIWRKKPNVPEAMKVRAMLMMGQFLWRLGKNEEARKWFEKCLKRSRRIGDKSGMASAMHKLGNEAYRRGDYATARSFYERSLRLYKKTSDKMGMADVLNNLGHISALQGDYKPASELLKKALATMRELGDVSRIIQVLINIGKMAYDGDDARQAKECWTEALDMARSIGDLRQQAAASNNLAILAQKDEHLDAARALHMESLTLHRKIGEKWGEGFSLFNLGMIAWKKKEYAEARLWFEESLRIRWEIQDREGIAYALEGLARVMKEEKDYEWSARILGVARALRDELRSVPPAFGREELDRLATELRLSLGDAEFSSAIEDGRALYLRDPSTLTVESEIFSVRKSR